MPVLAASSLGNIYDYSQGVHISSAQLYEEVLKRRDVYYSLGLRKSDKVIIGHGNSYQFFADLFGLWEIGVCAIPVDSEISLSELANLFKHSEAKMLICREEFNKEGLNDVMPEQISIINTDEHDYVFKHTDIKKFVDQNVQWEDTAIMLYTSGTTGNPKGVVHTFRSLMSRIFLLRPHVDLQLLDKSLNLLPTHFGHGLICNCLFPLLNGRDLILLPAFNLSIISELGKIIDENDVSFMSSVPAVWKMALMLSKPPQKKLLKRIHCGSAPLSSDLYKEICDWSLTNNVKNTYGITETGSWLAGTEDGKSISIDGYVGKGWGTDIIILSDQDNSELQYESFQELPSNEEGLVWVKTPALMKEYYKMPDLTGNVVKNSWFYTGDIGYKDKDGSLVLVGRKRNEINKAGMKIFPEDIDLVLERNEYVSEACAFAVKDSVSGQNIGVAVVLEESCSDKLVDVKKWLKENISPHKFPAKWYLVDEIPKTSRGKIKRDNVADFCINKLSVS